MLLHDFLPEVLSHIMAWMWYCICSECVTISWKRFL